MPADPPEIRYDVFISYARKDAALGAAPLYTALIGKDYTVWRDVKDIVPSNDFTEEIRQAIEGSHFFVLCLTSDVLRRNSYVRKELKHALLHGKRILVVRFQDVTPPASVRKLTWIDFFSGWDNAFEKLCETLNKEAIPSRRTNSSSDPFNKYIKWLHELAVKEIERSIPRRVELEVRTTESHEDVASFETRLIPYSIWDDELPKPAREPFTTLREAFENSDCDGRVLLLGEPGAGKTTMLLTFARNAAAARLSDPTQPLPIFARITGWDSSNQTPLCEWLAETCRGLSAEDLQAEIEAGRALLLLDGLDELGSRRPLDPNDPTKGEYDPRERFLKALPTTCKVILTSRVTEYRQIGQKAGLNCAVRLEPIDDIQIRSYLADAPDLWEVLTATPSLQDSLRSPLLLALFRIGFEKAPAEARALRDLSAGDLNDRIWDAFIDKRWTHEQSRHPDTPQPYTPAELKQWLGNAAMRAMGSWRRRDLTRILTKDVDTEDKDEVIFWALKLDLIRSAQSERVIPQIGEGLEKYHFLHLRLRDTLAYRSAIECIRDKKQGIRTTAIYCLLRLGDIRAVEPLIAALQDPKAHVRRSGIFALGQMGDTRAVEPLIAVLHDLDENVRRDAAHALGKLGDARAVEPLIAALQDPDKGVRTVVASTLGTLGDTRAVEPLITAFQVLDEDIRSGVADALGELGDARAVEPLIIALQEDLDERVRIHVANALGRLGDTRAVEPLIAALQDPVRFVSKSAAEALAALGDTRAIEPLIAALREANWHDRSSAIDALGKLGEPAIESLIAALQEPNEISRSSAVWGLGKFGDARAVEPLIAALRDPNEVVRGGAAEVLGRLGDTRAVEPLIASLRDPDKDIRYLAAYALRMFPDHPAAQQALENYRAGKVKPRRK